VPELTSKVAKLSIGELCISSTNESAVKKYLSVRLITYILKYIDGTVPQIIRQHKLSATAALTLQL